MGKIAVIFSGQGAQYVGMGNDICTLETANDIFLKASKAMGSDLTAICNDSERINITEFTQPAILTTSIALYEELSKHVNADAFAGLSLGEYSALVAACVLDFEEAVCLVNKRGRFMTEAVPSGVGSMAAIIGMDSEKVSEVIKDIKGVYVSNYNCPKQYVIGGYKESVLEAMNALKEAGARRAVELNVSGPFHTPLLSPAADKLREELKNLNIKENEKPVVMNYTGDYLTGNTLDLLVNQVMGSVRFEESIKRLVADGFDTFIEVGPGKVLSGFVKKIDRSLNIFNVEDKETLNKTISSVGGNQ